MLEKVLIYIKTRSIAYYIVAGIALFSLITTIIFFSTYNKPDLITQMGNRAEGLTPVTIGIFLLAGFVVELVVLAVPECHFYQLAAVAMFGLALYKDVLVIQDFIAGVANNVHYNGGNFPLNFFFFIALLLIVISSVVVCFMSLAPKKTQVAEAVIEKDEAPVEQNEEVEE